MKTGNRFDELNSTKRRRLIRLCNSGTSQYNVVGSPAIEQRHPIEERCVCVCVCVYVGGGGGRVCSGGGVRHHTLEMFNLNIEENA